MPWPVKVRSYNLIPRLARKHDIHLMCISRTEPTPEQRRWINTCCRTFAYVKHSLVSGAAQCLTALPTSTPLRLAFCSSKSARRAVAEACHRLQPDVVYVERWRALEFLPENLGYPLVCDPTDSMTVYNRRLMTAGSWWERVLGWEEFRKFSRCEGQLARRANATVFCSRLDMECVRKQASDACYELVPNGVDCAKLYFKDPSEEDSKTIIFTGSFGYRPNVHAVTFFLGQIFPRVRAEFPSARFLAVGNGAGRALAGFRSRPGFELIDFVEELRPYLAKATVAVAPLTVGSGVSNKVGEGFAVGTAVVATPLACGDLLAKSGEHLLIANSSEEFAAHTITLLKDAELRREMALRARRLVEAMYDWEPVSRKMEQLLQSVANTRPHAVRRSILSSV